MLAADPTWPPTWLTNSPLESTLGRDRKVPSGQTVLQLMLAHRPRTAANLVTLPAAIGAILEDIYAHAPEDRLELNGAGKMLGLWSDLLRAIEAEYRACADSPAASPTSATSSTGPGSVSSVSSASSAFSISSAYSASAAPQSNREFLRRSIKPAALHLFYALARRVPPPVDRIDYHYTDYARMITDASLVPDLAAWGLGGSREASLAREAADAAPRACTCGTSPATSPPPLVASGTASPHEIGTPNEDMFGPNFTPAIHGSYGTYSATATERPNKRPPSPMLRRAPRTIPLTLAVKNEVEFNKRFKCAHAGCPGADGDEHERDVGVQTEQLRKTTPAGLLSAVRSSFTGLEVDVQVKSEPSERATPERVSPPVSRASERGRYPYSAERTSFSPDSDDERDDQPTVQHEQDDIQNDVQHQHGDDSMEVDAPSSTSVRSAPRRPGSTLGRALAQRRFQAGLSTRSVSAPMPSIPAPAASAEPAPDPEAHDERDAYLRRLGRLHADARAMDMIAELDTLGEVPSGLAPEREAFLRQLGVAHAEATMDEDTDPEDASDAEPASEDTSEHARGERDAYLRRLARLHAATQIPEDTAEWDDELTRRERALADEWARFDAARDAHDARVTRDRRIAFEAMDANVRERALHADRAAATRKRFQDEWFELERKAALVGGWEGLERTRAELAQRQEEVMATAAEVEARSAAMGVREAKMKKKKEEIARRDKAARALQTGLNRLKTQLDARAEDLARMRASLAVQAAQAGHTEVKLEQADELADSGEEYRFR